MTTHTSAPTLTERLTTALLHATHPDGRPVHVPELIVTEALVPALLAELLPEASRTFTGPGETGQDVTVPVWDDPLLGKVTPWTESQGIPPVQVERSGLALLAVAAEMRRHDAWNGR